MCVMCSVAGLPAHRLGQRWRRRPPNASSGRWAVCSSCMASSRPAAASGVQRIEGGAAAAAEGAALLLRASLNPCPRPWSADAAARGNNALPAARRSSGTVGRPPTPVWHGCRAAGWRLLAGDGEQQRCWLCGAPAAGPRPNQAGLFLHDLQLPLACRTLLHSAGWRGAAACAQADEACNCARPSSQPAAAIANSAHRRTHAR